jgi:3-phenylpropionate/cinnamic acid dioxygenase small subunit
VSDADDVVALNRLAYRYAEAVDARDVDAFLAVFHPDGRMRSFAADADEPFSDVVGHEQLAAVPRRMAELWRRTAHQMTNHLVTVDGDTATGTLLCAARYLGVDPAEAMAGVNVIRYVDRYERRTGEWRIADRELHFLWSERHPLSDGSG